MFWGAGGLKVVVLKPDRHWNGESWVSMQTLIQWNTSLIPRINSHKEDRWWILLPLYDNTAALCGFPIKTCWRIFTLLYVHNFYFSPIRYDRGATLLRKEKKKKATDLWLKRRTSHPEKKKTKKTKPNRQKEKRRGRTVLTGRAPVLLYPDWPTATSQTFLFLRLLSLLPFLPPAKKTGLLFILFLNGQKKASSSKLKQRRRRRGDACENLIRVYTDTRGSGFAPGWGLSPAPSRLRTKPRPLPRVHTRLKYEDDLHTFSLGVLLTFFWSFLSFQRLENKNPVSLTST